MTDDGYRKYKKFFQSRPLLTLEWNDDKSDSVGWLVINSLEGGASGGGTRMHQKATRSEAVFLAKTMEVKFRISGPLIGGAKSVIRVSFDPRDEKRKRDVLARWYKAIGPFLRHCYGTAGDLNVDARAVKELTRDVLSLSHPQEGIVRGHFNGLREGKYEEIFDRINKGVAMRLTDLPVPQTVANMITGYGVARSVRHYYELRGERLEGKRVLVEGFGEVGGAAALYLAREGARVVGILSLASRRDGEGSGDARTWAINNGGLDVNRLFAGREKNCLPRDYKDCETGTVEESKKFWDTEADVFVPAASSHTVGSSTIRRLKRAGVSTIACGANVPFSFEAEGGDRSVDMSEIEDMGEMAKDSLTSQMEADSEFGIIPDFIANCGMARLFAYLMEPGADVSVASIFEDTDNTIRGAMRDTLADHAGGPGMLNHAYSIYVPEAEGRGEGSVPSLLGE